MATSPDDPRLLITPIPDPVDPATYGTPDFWRATLEKQLSARSRELQRYDDYYTGKHPLRFASEKFRKAFGLMFREFADNWMEIVVDVCADRLNVEGFRLASDEVQGDDAAWAIWQRNGLDAFSEIAHTEALINGESYALVWPGKDGAAITIEHPLEMIVAVEPETQIRSAAFKKWIGDDGYGYSTLYLPDGLYKYRTRTKMRSTASKADWVPRDVPGETWPLKNPLGVVPVIPLRNKPRLLAGYESELKRVTPIQDAVNKLVTDMLVASEYYAFRARWATGLEIPTDPLTRKPIEDLKMAADRVWLSPDPQSRFGEFGQTDLGNYVKAIEMFVQHIASQTRTPPHYFALQGQFPSGDAIKSAETGLVAKVKRKARHFGEAWEEVIRLAFLVEGDATKAGIMDSEVIWADFETRSEAELADALLKQQMIGVPDEALWRRAQYSPTEIKEFKRMREEQPPPPPTVRETLTGAAPPESTLIEPGATQTGGPA